MQQPEYLGARVVALENVELHVESLDFAHVLCDETLAVKREAPMQVACPDHECSDNA
jgi:hypothetical protein